MDYRAFFPRVKPYAIGAPDSTIVRHVRDACIDFCERTLLWQEDIDPITSNGVNTTWDLPIDSEVELAGLISVSVPETTYRRRNGPEIVNEQVGSARILANLDQDPIAFTDREVLIVWPAPSAGVVITGRVALKPSGTSSELDDRVFELYGRQIAKGALSTLLLQPGEWKDPTMAAKYEREFNLACSTTTLQRARGFTRGALRMRSWG